MNQIRHYFVLLVVVTIILSACNNSQKDEPTRPNIIYIMSDDHAYQAISAYGFGLNDSTGIRTISQKYCRQTAIKPQ